MVDYSLYLVTNTDAYNRYDIRKSVEEAILGGVTFVQVREKDKTYEEFYNIASNIKDVTDRYNIPLVINDNAYLAKELNADGVHVGQEDMTCIEARKIVGNNKLVGVTVRDLAEAKKAIEDGADYLGVGAIFTSTTKKDAKVVGREELKRICDYSSIPVVVIGGINESTIPSLHGIKIDGYAMIRPILDNDDIKSKSIELKELINKNKEDLHIM